MPEYYEMALKLEKDSHVASNGALLANSYARKGELGEAPHVPLHKALAMSCRAFALHWPLKWYFVFAISEHMPWLPCWVHAP